MSRILRRVALVVALTLIVVQGAVASTYSAIIVFGDSLSDTGNINAATGGASPGAAYFQGRFSNGPLWIDRIANTQGIQVRPSLLGGTNYAYGGARVTSNVPAGSFSIPSLPNQLQQYLARVNGRADPQALYVIFGGGNDQFATLTNPALAATLPGDFSRAIVGMLDSLVRAGARNVLLFNAPNVGRTPFVASLGPVASQGASVLGQQLNGALKIALFFSVSARRLNLDVVDLYDTLSLGALDTGSPNTPGNGGLGFTNITSPCLNTLVNPPTVCADPTRSFFWDGVHPTVFGHSFIAIAARQALSQ